MMYNVDQICKIDFLFIFSLNLGIYFYRKKNNGKENRLINDEIVVLYEYVCVNS